MFVLTNHLICRLLGTVLLDIQVGLPWGINTDILVGSMCSCNAQPTKARSRPLPSALATMAPPVDNPCSTALPMARASSRHVTFRDCH